MSYDNRNGTDFEHPTAFAISCGHPADDIDAKIDVMHDDPQFAAEVAAFHAGLDAQWAAEMERLDAEAEARKAQRDPVIQRSIYTATRGRFEARVTIDGKQHKLGFHKTEGLANAAVDRYLRGLFPRLYRVARAVQPGAGWAAP